MGGLLAGLATLAQPVLARIMLALGVSVLTVGGAVAVVAQVKGMLLAKIGDAPMAALQLAGLAGVWSGLGIVLGSVAFAVAFYGATKAVKIAGAA